MKAKFLLAATLFITTLSAQNLVINGGFDEDFVPFTYNGANFTCPEYIEGWEKNDDYAAGNYNPNNFNNIGVSKWNTRAEIKESSIDEIIDEPWLTEEKAQFIRLQRFEDNGWYNGGLYQAIDVTPGETYTLSCYYKANTGEVAPGCREAEFYINIREYAPNRDGQILEEYTLEPAAYWTEFKKEIKIDSSVEKIHIYIGLNHSNCGETKSANKNVYVDFDEIFLGKENSGGTNITGNKADERTFVKIEEGNIRISGTQTATPITLYNISGTTLNQGIATYGSYTIPANNYPKGTYILKVGTNTYKVML